MELARSFLFVPGDRSDRFAKALSSGADVVICDLEDAVSISRKEYARTETSKWLDSGGSAIVRINAVNSPEFPADCLALLGRVGVRALMVPKSEDPEALKALHHEFGGKIPIIALIETALGLFRVHEISEVPGVVRLAFGSIDFAFDIDASNDSHALDIARFKLVMASRVAGLVAPIDGVTTDLDNPDVTASAAKTARDLGFGGKLCIHPTQIEIVNKTFMPTSDEIRQAQEILSGSSDSGAYRLRGQMVDKPVVDRARLNLKRAGLLAHEAEGDRTP